MKVGRVGGFEGSPTGHRSVCGLAFGASWTFKRACSSYAYSPEGHWDLEMERDACDRVDVKLASRADPWAFFC